MMTTEEKLQTLAKAVGVNGAKYVTYYGDDYLLLPEVLPTRGQQSLVFNPYTDANTYNFIIEQLGCSLDYDLSNYYESGSVCINIVVHTVSSGSLFFKTISVGDKSFTDTLRKETLDLLVEVLTTSANTAATVQSTKP